MVGSLELGGLVGPVRSVVSVSMGLAESVGPVGLVRPVRSVGSVGSVGLVKFVGLPICAAISLFPMTQPCIAYFLVDYSLQHAQKNTTNFS